MRVVALRHDQILHTSHGLRPREQLEAFQVDLHRFSSDEDALILDQSQQLEGRGLIQTGVFDHNRSPETANALPDGRAGVLRQRLGL